MRRLLTALKQISRFRLVVFTVVLAILNAFFTNVAYDLAGRAASPLWSAVALPDWFGLAVALVVLLALFVWALFYGLSRAGKLLGSTATMTPAEIQAPAKFLILGFSPIVDSVREAALAEVRTHGVELVVQNSKDYEKACVERGISQLRQPWQQSLRAVKPHISALEHVFILAPEPDEARINEFVAYLETCFPRLSGKIRFVTRAGETRPFLTYSSSMQRPVTLYEDYAYVHDGIKRAIEMADAIMPENKRAKTDVCVDATAGNKTFSIGAAIATLNSHCVFSYVGNDGIPRFYDAEVEIGGDV